jgi:two-component system sensor histidine kinase AlgZ
MSINQKAGDYALPNFHNLGILLRLLLFVNAAALMVAVVQSNSVMDAWQELIEICARVQPPLLAVVLILTGVQPWLGKLPYAGGVIAVTAIAVLVTAAWHQLAADLVGGAGGLERALLFAGLVTLAALSYFSLRTRALSPALSEARLQALQARIRPHFLFNSLNAVLSLIREDPRRAEMALEDLSDLFRVLMADNRELTPLSREVDLCRQYLAIEELRLGPRLRIDWQVGAMPGDALVPPLILQPLIENAVYHGIEPRSTPGTITIRIWRDGDQVRALLRNPYQAKGDRHSGNRMALANIRERLQLHFDAEASLTSSVQDDVYEVQIVIPYHQTQPGRPA